MNTWTMVYGWSFISMVIGLVSLGLLFIPKIGNTEKFSVFLMSLFGVSFAFNAVYGMIYSGIVFFKTVLPAICG